MMGNELNLSGKVSINSKLINQPRNAFPVSSDRFSRTLTITPDPGAYSPKYNLNENIKSSFVNPGSTRFSKDTKTFVDRLWKPKDRAETPAPGTY
jgi:hypothetical protein